MNFSGKEGHPNIQPSTRPGTELGTSGLGSRDLNHCANPSAIVIVIVIVIVIMIVIVIVIVLVLVLVTVTVTVIVIVIVTVIVIHNLFTN